METHWAIDLGTTNTLIAKWVGTHAVTVALEELVDYEPAWQTPLIPSAIYFQDGNRAIIGRPALAAREIIHVSDLHTLGPLARSFKKTLARASQQAVAQIGTETVSARQCTTVFLRELLEATAAYQRQRALPATSRLQRLITLLRWWRKEGQVTHLTMTVPVDSYEPYRAELSQIARKLGVSHFQTIDEPVAAALGYGLDLTDEKHVMVVDFGGGTLDIAIVRTHPPHSGMSRESSPGQHRATLLAARGLMFGGETVDGWIADLGCEKLRAHQEILRPVLLAQAEAIKKDLSNKASIADSSFFLLQGGGRIEVTRAEFLETLEKRGLYRTLETLTAATLDDCKHQISEADLDAVLLVGGSTLLPGVRELFERLFGPQRVHYWEPFEAVVKGAAIYGAGYSVDQIVHHDYAIRVYNDAQQRPEYERLVRRGTSYPTPNPFETRYYAVTEGQQLFRLPICEVGYAGRVSLPWTKRVNGNDYWLPTGSEEGECVITLNEGDAYRLQPPGNGPQARLRIDFTIDANRFLCATVHDLLKQRDLRTDDRVVRLR
ncbi:MAG: Hsp70 family protein [Chloroherpetonaceae bacterium]|nr:Hsp70 family protein [Chthonomonadaceae bacterium]MDW8208090.1 Hsp70 family protein [Chloroherpetonaceae bacterium]